MSNPKSEQESELATQTAETAFLSNIVFTDGTVHSRALAISAGDYRVAVMREVRRILADSHGHQLKAAKVGLERLKGSKLITAQELKALSQICDLVFAAQRGKAKPDDAFAQVRAIYDRMLVDTTANPVALTIASIAASGSITATPDNGGVPEGALAAMNRSDKVDMGILGGVIGGAVVGGAIGGVGGAIIGGVIGGIAGGISTACAT